ncbi:hypothetical protein CIY_34080 [Butyrivibrio fibrisolvens 16/4]|nr:hypothetical protein CIY_34080 [Butyrivibrio fibrisolvens 16/4]
MLFLLCSCSNNTKDELVTKEKTEKNAIATSEESVEKIKIKMGY